MLSHGSLEEVHHERVTRMSKGCTGKGGIHIKGISIIHARFGVENATFGIYGYNYGFIDPVHLWLQWLVVSYFVLLDYIIL